MEIFSINEGNPVCCFPFSCIYSERHSESMMVGCSAAHLRFLPRCTFEAPLKPGFLADLNLPPCRCDDALNRPPFRWAPANFASPPPPSLDADRPPSLKADRPPSLDADRPPSLDAERPTFLGLPRASELSCIFFFSILARLAAGPESDDLLLRTVDDENKSAKRLANRSSV